MSKIKNDRFMRWTSIIATIATTVLALTALITVYLTVEAWKVQQNTARPYFVLKESPQINLEKELELELKFTNVGIHPAVNLSSETIIFSENLIGKPIHHDESAIVNEIPKDSALSLVMAVSSQEIYPQQSNLSPQYVVVDIQYFDPILDKSYNQSIYLKWDGIMDGKVQSTVHVRVEEKEKILTYFKKQNIDPQKRSR